MQAEKSRSQRAPTFDDVETNVARAKKMIFIILTTTTKNPLPNVIQLSIQQRRRDFVFVLRGGSTHVLFTCHSNTFPRWIHS